MTPAKTLSSPPHRRGRRERPQGEAPKEEFDTKYLLAMTLVAQEEFEEAGGLFLELLPGIDAAWGREESADEWRALLETDGEN